MTHFSQYPGRVRVDRFKSSGKWYDTIAVDMTPHYDERFVHDAVQKALEDAGYPLVPSFSYVCLEPYHKNAHPVMLRGRESEI